MAEGCGKRKRDPLKVAQQVGRLLGKNSRAAGLFQVEVETDTQGWAHLRWSKFDERRHWMKLSEGCYMLRSNVTDWSGEELWHAYIQLTEAEEAFRLHKSDLVMRPVWHQKEHRVQAHILVCFLAYVLWKTLGQWCQRAGVGDEQRKIFAELQQISLVDVVTYAEYEANAEENIRQLHRRLVAGKYQAQPLRRVYIQKENGKHRT